ncbi:hypothetical protein L7F22_034472 [Adiantum nelumboides]|nr:hypothetical protein [Adiantum nelumboides]
MAAATPSCLEKNNSSMPQKQRVDLWQVVKCEMNRTCHGFDKDSEACRKEWRCVYREYDKCLRAAGNGSQKCKFYDLMDLYMGEKTNGTNNLQVIAVECNDSSPRKGDQYQNLGEEPAAVETYDRSQLLARLRDVKQLGLCHMVFPGAVHTRFEHSLGVYCLADQAMSRLQQFQGEELGIERIDIQTVKLAGLLHDVGHGPFSHVFENEFLPKVAPDEPRWKSDPNFSAAPMASDEGQSNPSTSGDAGGDHIEDYGNAYGPHLPTQEELREMEHRRLAGEATNMMLNFSKDPKLAKYMTETAFQDVHAQWKATTTSPPKTDSKKQYSEKELEQEGSSTTEGESIERSAAYPNYAPQITRIILIAMWTHEHMSQLMVQHMVDEHNIDIDQKHLKEIQNMIVASSHLATPIESQEKRFLYDIVANGRNGIDVDKFDYIERDCRACGISNSFCFPRLMENMRVIDNEICYRAKENRNVYDLFQTRANLFRTVYTHAKVKALEYMLVDAFLLANDYLRISDTVLDPQEFWKLDDTILKVIETSNDRELAAAREIVIRMRRRELYQYCNEYAVPKEKLEHFKTVRAEDIVCSQVKSGVNLSPDDIVVSNVKIDLTRGKEDPVQRVHFFKDYESDEKFIIPKERISHLLPDCFEDRIVRVYSKKPGLVDAVSEAFENFQLRTYGIKTQVHGTPNGKKRRSQQRSSTEG